MKKVFVGVVGAILLLLAAALIVPSFMVSELKTAFQIGFLVFIPFLVIDLVVASVLMSMGMMMLSPILISLPFKLMLFVLVDGWSQPQFMVEINGAGQGANTDVFTISGSDVTLRALSINRGPRDGVLISSGVSSNRSDNIAIFACNIGVDPTGTIDRGNTGDGVQITFADRVTIGGPETWQSCLISGNGADGVNVEVHAKPEDAKSDAAQQLDDGEFIDLNAPKS